MSIAVVLKPGEEARLRHFYPWVRREQVQQVQGEAPAGTVARVLDARGQFVAQGFFDAGSHIPVRVLSLDERPIDAAFFAERIRAAGARRSGSISGTDSWRVVHGEADQLPGLIVDKLGEVIVVQSRNAGMDRHKPAIVEALLKDFQPRGIYERSDVEARAAEGLPEAVGTLWGEVPQTVTIHEDDVEFAVNLQSGQKTGFYLDQRDNRRLLREMVRPGERVLDVYSYIGSFGLHAARAGASVLCVDKDAAALTLAEQNARRNGVAERLGVRWGDALKVLEALGEEGRQFRHVVLDPPTLVKRREDLPRTRRLFAELCLRATRLLEARGVLLLSSCAHYVTLDDLLDAARSGCNQAGRRVEVIRATHQPADHPWILQVPETLYLKSLFLRID